MDGPDIANGLFEFGGAIAISMSIQRLWIDKRVAGISWPMIGFFTSWGMWNLFYYPQLNQMFSFAGGVAVVTANCIYLTMLIYYSRRVDMFKWLLSFFGGPPAADPKQVTKVQAAVVKACGFLPAAQTVIAIFAAANPTVATVSTVATAICRAVSKPKVSGLLDLPPVVHIDGIEIPIEGEFVEK